MIILRIKIVKATLLLISLINLSELQPITKNTKLVNIKNKLLNNKIIPFFLEFILIHHSNIYTIF